MKNVLFLFIICFSTNSWASWDIMTVDNSTHSLGTPSLALDTSDYPHIAYTEYINSSTIKLKYAKWDGNNFQIQTIDNNGYNPSIDIDSNNNIAIAYYDSINKDFKCALYTNNSWYIVVVDSEGNIGNNCSLVFDSTGNIHIAYFDYTNIKTKYAKWIGGNFQIQTIVNEWNPATAIAIDSNNNPCICFANYLNIKYTHWTGTSWLTENVLQDGPFEDNISIGIDSNNNPHIIYIQHITETFSQLSLPQLAGPIIYLRRMGTSWLFQKLPRFNTSSFSFKIDSYDKIHISFTDINPSGCIKYGYSSGNGWEIEMVQNSELGYCENPSLRFGKQKKKCIAYTYNYAIYYALQSSVVSTSTFSIEGYIRYSNNSGVNNMYLSLLGSTTKEYITSDSGYYKFTNLPMGDYKIIPDNTPYIFNPSSLTYISLNSNQNNQNLTCISYDIKGYIKDSNGHGLVGIDVFITPNTSNDNYHVISSTNGYYELTNLSSGTYKITPLSSTYLFYPETIMYRTFIENQDTPIFLGTLNILNKVKVFPNPYKSDRGYKQINITGLTAQVTIKIFTIAGELVKTIEETDGYGHTVWYADNDSGEKVASGIYIYLITNSQGQKATGKIAVVQ
jgi:hypothetical protein